MRAAAEERKKAKEKKQRNAAILSLAMIIIGVLLISISSKAPSKVADTQNQVDAEPTVISEIESIPEPEASKSDEIIVETFTEKKLVSTEEKLYNGDFENTQYEYYSNGLLKKISAQSYSGDSSDIETFYYDDNGLLIEWHRDHTVDNRHGKTTTKYSYDDNGLLIEEDTKVSETRHGNKHSTIRYYYNDNSQLVKKVRKSSFGTYTNEYSYDGFGNLVEESEITDDGQTVSKVKYIYEYDPVSNDIVCEEYTSENNPQSYSRTYYVYNNEMLSEEHILHGDPLVEEVVVYYTYEFFPDGGYNVYKNEVLFESYDSDGDMILGEYDKKYRYLILTFEVPK